MYKAKILSAVVNSENPDWISVIVEYTDGVDTFTRQYDWVSNTVTAGSIELTIKDELKKMNIDTPAILGSLQIGKEITS